MLIDVEAVLAGPALGTIGVERPAPQRSGAAHDPLLSRRYQGGTVGLAEARKQDVTQTGGDSVVQILVATKPDLAVGT